MMPTKRNQNWLPDIFNDLFDYNWMNRTNATAPAINVVENENNYRIEVAAPGLKKEDFTLHIDESNNLVSFSHNSQTWQSMWYQNYCELDISGIPTEIGTYNVAIYFNGALAGSQKFEITT